MYVLIVCLHKGLELTLGQSLVMRMLIVFALPWTTLQICALKIPRNCCIFEIPWKVVFFAILLHWFKCTNYSLYDINKYFQKHNWKYHSSAVFGTVIKCPKGTRSTWETLHHKKLYFWQSIYLEIGFNLITW